MPEGGNRKIDNHGARDLDTLEMRSQNTEAKISADNGKDTVQLWKSTRRCPQNMLFLRGKD